MEELAMRRRLLWIIPGLAAVAATGLLLAKDPVDPVCPPGVSAPVSRAKDTPAQGNQASGSPELPITQVVLYSNGVGYFQRDGQVEGNAHVDLSFPMQDVNDLLKSMVLQDLGGGQVSAVSYDSQDPLDKTLNSFAIRLADNPGQSKILNQARGEKVEVITKTSAPFQGTVVGVETKPPAAKDGAPVEMLNLWCVDGIHNLPLAEVACVRFLNPAVEGEMRRALEVLATSHDSQKKSVILQFSGSGKRDVRVGYVVETPLWRTSYRLLVDKKGKVFVQGWALVENPSSEDWKDVRMALVSARPISFKMDLYQPLYAPRPLVQNQISGNIGPVSHDRATPRSGEGMDYGANASVPPPVPSAAFANGQTVNAGASIEQGYPAGGASSIRMGSSFTQGITPAGTYTPDPWISLQKGVVPAATASDLGNSFQYAIEQPVTIPRQKSALLPIVNQGLEGDKVSVYSAQAQTKYALLALRLKNTSGVHLMQGPVAVYEGNGYAGDAQMPDFRPNEERLISYAVDLGVEVDAKPGKASSDLANIRLHKGKLTSTALMRHSVTYSITNSSPHDRVVLVEHPRRTSFRLVSKDKPREESADVSRFEKKVAAGKTVTLEVVEENDANNTTNLIDLSPDMVRWFTKREFKEATAEAAFAKLLALQNKVTATKEESVRVKQELDDITRDQARLRANLKEMPATSAAYKRYLEKFDKQETTIEKLQERIQDLQSLAEKQRLEYETFVNSLDLEATVQGISDSRRKQ
jgi:hypothetical protein